MKRFADLHLYPPAEKTNRTRIFNKYAELGYDLVGVSLPIDVTKSRIQQLRRICHHEGLDLATRLDLVPMSVQDLNYILRRTRYKFEIISVTCVSKPVSRQAAKDRRVDLISYRPYSRERFFDMSTAKFASKALAAFEVNMAPLLFEKGIRRAKIISNLRREVRTARKFNLRIVISSGSTNEYSIRTPQDFAALSTLFDLTPQQSLKAISEVPIDLIERNRKKQSQEYIAPGIHLKKEEI
jgi:ribonuclease P/MRP protein subunit RPP1